jgi:malonyl-CoA/methylmalonyl-CoA synthetase
MVIRNDNLYELFSSRFPDDDRTWLEAPDNLVYTWGDIRRATAMLANLLASLRQPAGARIAAHVGRSPEALLLYLATLRTGYVFVPLNPAYRESEVEYFLNDAEPSVVVASDVNRAWAEPLARRAKAPHFFTLNDNRTGSFLEAAARERDEFATVARREDDLAAIIYTSGTTGRSKGAMLTHGNLASNALALHEYWRWQQSDVLLHGLPIFHVHGLFVAANGSLLSGAKMIWLAKFETAAVLRQLPRATVFMGVPTYYTRLLADSGLTPDVCRNMRLFVSGSAPLLAETHAEFRRRTGHVILERYGMSETLMITSNPYEEERRPGTVGFPLPGVAVRVVNDDGKECAPDEVGMIELKGSNVFSGYWRMPEKTAEEFSQDGYFRTGDLGRFDNDGYLTIVGRSKDVIITAGDNVYPKEIEGYIDELPGVAESAVVGIPHPDLGEAVCAAVVCKSGAPLSESEVIVALKAKIASYKVPKRVIFVEELPRNAMGKVQKVTVRTLFA